VTYREAVAWLYGQQLHGIRLGLETMQQLCAELLIPVSPADEGAPIYLHVAGTNGKGSVCAMLDAMLRAGGVRTGLYTSPHLVTFRERIRLDGEMISEAEVAAGLATIREMTESWETRPTFFEIVTALALRWFADQRAEVVVLETGLGGRLDATNVVTPAVSVLTPIGFDHQHYLGDTLTAIALEKAGIIKSLVPVVSAPQTADAAEVIKEAAAACGAEFTLVQAPWQQSQLVLHGVHQMWNAALAVAALDAGAGDHPILELSAGTKTAGLGDVVWPGRFQRVNERIVLDGAHNAAAARQLAATWRAEFGDSPTTLVLGVMRDKDVHAVCAELVPLARRVLTVRVENARSCSPEELAATVRIIEPVIPVLPCSSLREALAWLGEEGCVLIAGSLFLVGEALVALGLAHSENERSEQ
jgi:dihydrofolate synthase/folylpolyglutamate synthase